MSLLLYDNPMSSNALKVRFLLAELGLDYDRREVPLARPRPDWYVEVNPVGGIPTLADGDLVLAESHAILRYLAAREGRYDLMGEDALERARVDELLDRWHTRLRPAFFQVEAPALGLAGMAPDAEAATAAAERVQADIQLAERVVGDGFAVLGRFTIADAALAPVLFRTTKIGLSLDAFPKLAALRDGVMARPSWAAAGPVT